MAKGRIPGIRWIDGQEYLLAGRVSNKEAAEEDKVALQATWRKVRIVKFSDFDYRLFVHGRLPALPTRWDSMEQI